jgi:hypothetical protein
VAAEVRAIERVVRWVTGRATTPIVSFSFFYFADLTFFALSRFVLRLAWLLRLKVVFYSLNVFLLSLFLNKKSCFRNVDFFRLLVFVLLGRAFRDRIDLIGNSLCFCVVLSLRKQDENRFC